jgi:vacuolar-type H+-ATPase subunit I/STV1
MNKLQQLHDRAALAISPLALVLAQINIKPDKSKAPGSDGLADVINGFAWYTLLAAAAGFLIGGACWAIGGRIGNDYTATGGKVGMAVSTGVAFLVGAAAAILNFAYNTGNS